jgi:hypothetical protein
MGDFVSVPAKGKEGREMQEYSGNALAPVSGSPLAKPMLSHTSTGCSARRILLVENEEAQRQLYEQELNEEGYVVL